MRKKTEAANKNVAPKQRKPRAKKVKEPQNLEKELATQRGEPYVAILRVELDPENIGNGAFELDWNDKFVANLVRAGYQHKPNEDDSVIVDRWFQDVCRTIVLEMYEQQQAAPENRDIRVVKSKDIGDGRTEIS